MLDGIRSFVARYIAPAAPESPAGESEAPLDRVKIAACALLLEVAHADGEFTPDEQARMEEALDRHFGLPPALRAELLALADTERRRSVDHFQFTSLIREQYDLGQKVLLAELMWGVILADGHVADHEGYLVRKLGALLELPPAYLSEARRKAGH